MNPLFGNGAKCVFDDFGPTAGEPLIQVRRHPSGRSPQASQTAATNASDSRLTASDLRGCAANPEADEKVPRRARTGGPARPLRDPGIEQAVVGGEVIDTMLAPRAAPGQPEAAARVSDPQGGPRARGGGARAVTGAQAVRAAKWPIRRAVDRPMAAGRCGDPMDR